MKHPVINLTMKDGSRHFLGLPADHHPSRLWLGVKLLPHAKTGEYLEDIVEAWFDFTYKGLSYSVHNTFGEFWFFANDPEAPEQDLHFLRVHFLTVIGLEEDI